MTSRDVSGKGFWDQLDAMIGWALRESVADVTPPADTWERISRKLRGQARSEVAQGRSFRVVCTSVALWLLESVVGPPAEFVYCDARELGHVRDKYYLCLLMYQHDLPMLLGQAV